MKINTPLILAAGCFSLLVGTTDAVRAGKGKQSFDDQQESASAKRKTSPSSESSYNFRPRPRTKMASPKRKKLVSNLMKKEENEKPESSFAVGKKISIPTPKTVHWDYKYDTNLKIWYMGKSVSEIEIPQHACDPSIKINNGYMYILE